MGIDLLKHWASPAEEAMYRVKLKREIREALNNLQRAQDIDYMELPSDMLTTELEDIVEVLRERGAEAIVKKLMSGGRMK